MKIRRLKSFTTLTGVMLVLMMSVTLALPSGVHLELCFGDDGHFDLAPDSCLDKSFLPSPQQIIDPSGQEHHIDCLDIAVACNSFIQFIRSADNDGAFKTINQKAPPSAAGSFSVSFFPRFDQPKLLASLPAYHQSILPSHLTVLRTVILLI